MNDEIFEEALDGDEVAENASDNALERKQLRWIYGMRRRMRELLALPAPDCEGRTDLEERGVPPENIDNCMLLMGMLFRLALDGNIRAFQELRSITGDNETELDRRIKLAQLCKTKVQTEEIRRKNSDNDDSEKSAGTSFFAALEESAVSLWQNGGDGQTDEQEKE